MSDVLREQGPVINRRQLAPRPPTTIVGPHVEDLVTLYALGTLEPDDQARVDRHCATCERCTDALAREQHVLANLAFLAPPAVPNPAVKLSLFARIDQVQRSAKRLLSGDRRSGSPPALTLPSSRPAETDLPVDRQRWSLPRRISTRPAGSGWVRSLLSIAAIPLLLLVTVGGYWGIQLRDKISERDDQMTELQAQINTMAQTLPTDGNEYQMQAAADAPAAQGTIAVSPDEKSATVFVQLSQPSPTKTYDAYVVKDGKIIRSVPVPLDENGRGSARIPLEEPFANYQTVKVEARPMPTDGTDGEDSRRGSSVLSYEHFKSIGGPDELPMP